MRYEQLTDAPKPADEDFACLYSNNGNPVRDHFVCYRVSEFGQPRRYVVAGMASEDTDFYDYRGAPPEDRGLQIHSVYRVHESENTNGYDQHHIVICFADKSVEFTGESFGISEPIEGRSAVAVLLEYVRQTGVGG